MSFIFIHTTFHFLSINISFIKSARLNSNLQFTTKIKLAVRSTNIILFPIMKGREGRFFHAVCQNTNVFQPHRLCIDLSVNRISEIVSRNEKMRLAHMLPQKKKKWWLSDISRIKVKYDRNKTKIPIMKLLLSKNHTID